LRWTVKCCVLQWGNAHSVCEISHVGWTRPLTYVTSKSSCKLHSCIIAEEWSLLLWLSWIRTSGKNTGTEIDVNKENWLTKYIWFVLGFTLFRIEVAMIGDTKQNYDDWNCNQKMLSYHMESTPDTSPKVVTHLYYLLREAL
jgi:hypothetical protein